MGTQEKAKQKTRQAREKAAEAADQATEQARDQAARQKEQATGRVSGVARALRKTGEQLRAEEQEMVAVYVEEAGRQVQRFAGYLQERSPEDLVGEAERFARRDPALFLGGAFALGLLGARFLKSSGRRSPAAGGGTSRAGQPGPAGSSHGARQRSGTSERPRSRRDAAGSPGRMTGASESKSRRDHSSKSHRE